MEKEIWKDIKEYEGLYQISNFGRVKSLKRKVYAGRGRMRWQYEKILSENKTNGNGYKIVSLCKKILQLDDNNKIINVFPSISEASRQLKVSYQAISDCLKGKQKHSAGYKWKYANID